MIRGRGPRCSHQDSGQILKMFGLSSALQFIIQGIAIAFGMAVAK